MCNATHGACANVRVRQALNYALDVPAPIGTPSARRSLSTAR